jgi:hypothetical protein
MAPEKSQTTAMRTVHTIERRYKGDGDEIRDRKEMQEQRRRNPSDDGDEIRATKSYKGDGNESEMARTIERRYKGVCV